MAEIMPLLDNNPAVFFSQLESYINRGYYATDTVVGYPQFGVLNTITLTEGDQPAELDHDFSGDEVLVQEYDNTKLVLLVQDAILKGYTVDLSHILLNQFCAPHEIRLTRKVAPTFALGPVDADPVPTPTPVAQNSSQETTEAPKPVNKGGRPAKQKSKEI